ncbi:MAG: hypothetical protein P4N59_07485 [Negativicutes bacterium]|nr:hypothetical protein [Negativicutes bacterium]
MNEIAEHVEKLTITMECVVPDHDPRVGESAIFDHSVKQLKADGNWRCYICGATDHLESHHYKCEKSRENIVDFDKLKEELLKHDILGYSKAMADIPLTSVDDIRNQMPLCMPHHRGKGTGAHFLTEEDWIAQKICLANPIPQVGETEAEVMARVKEAERK